MILADKLIQLRKKSGMSQEELAEKMNVSRQAVSKWEGAQSIPDLDKILQLSELYGVTTDYLLKDSVESEEFTGKDTDENIRKVTLEEANEFLALRKTASVRIAAATLFVYYIVDTALYSGRYVRAARQADLREYGGRYRNDNNAGFDGDSGRNICLYGLTKREI